MADQTTDKPVALHHENVAAHRVDDDDAMRGALLIEAECAIPVWQSARNHARAFVFFIAPFSAGMLWGYDSIVNGASISMPAFLLFYGEIGADGSPFLPSNWTALWTAMSSLSQAVGALAVGFIADRWGRKWPATSAALITVVGTAMQYYASSRGLLLGGKMLNGFGIGAAMVMATTYLSEVAPIKLRGPVQQGFVLFYVSMMAVGLGVVRAFVPDIKEQSFRNVFALQWAVGGFAAVAWALTPESPNYLITRDRLPEAHKVLSRIFGAENSIDARHAILVRTIKEEQNNTELTSASYLDCFKGTDLRRTLIVVFLLTATMVGGQALLSQSIYFLIIAGLEAIHAFDVSIAGFGLSILIIITTWMLGPKVRRYIAFGVGCTLNFLFMTTIGALYYAPGDGPLWGIAVLMNVLISLQTSMIQAMAYPIAAEISSYRLRAKTLSVGVIAQTLLGWLTTFVVPYIYNVDAGNLGARTAFIFAATSIFLICGSYFFVPETSGMTMEEIDCAFEKRVPARRFEKLIPVASAPSLKGEMS